ncbi:hypothetical protein J2W14_004122 [Pseudarthrobacter oxydans]|nr:hypothetical protein [Pseudarthrobacter oxydans]
MQVYYAWFLRGLEEFRLRLARLWAPVVSAYVSRS